MVASVHTRVCFVCECVCEWEKREATCYSTLPCSTVKMTLVKLHRTLNPPTTHTHTHTYEATHKEGWNANGRGHTAKLDTRTGYEAMTRQATRRATP